MKKLLFLIPTYTQGGTNRSLQFLLSMLNSNDLYIMSKRWRSIQDEILKL